MALLEEHLIPHINNLPEYGINSTIFQQDNAPIHKAHKMRAWFGRQTFPVMEWPASSPDMNPIEHMWAALKSALHHRFPDTKDIPGAPPAVQRILEERLTLVWADLGPEIMDSLVESMPRRVAALIAAEGWYTKY
jgi:hypothetical protein